MLQPEYSQIMRIDSESSATSANGIMTIRVELKLP